MIALVDFPDPLLVLCRQAGPTHSNDTRDILSTAYICVLQLFYDRIFILTYLSISDSYDVIVSGIFASLQLSTCIQIFL